MSRQPPEIVVERTAERTADRQRAARVLAAAETARLASLWAGWPEAPEVAYLRGPEAGLVMVQGRIGGRGDRFNLGEATVTRATVLLRGGRLDGEVTGTAYVLGSDTEHAGLAAIFAGLLDDVGERGRVLEAVIAPLEREQAARDAERRTAARATVVDFLTVARENTAGRIAAESEEDEE